MVDYNFLPNLRTDTIDPAFRRYIGMTGYLVPPQTASTRIAATAAKLPKIERRLVDNGNFILIKRISKRFANTASKLYSMVEHHQKQLKRSVGKNELSPKQFQAFQHLAEDITTSVRKTRSLTADSLRRQLSLSPTHLVGYEDITLAIFISLNMEEEYLDYPTRYYEGINRTVAREALAVQAMLSLALKQAYYPVASAMSYDSAFLAGRIFAQYGIKRVAMGFGAYMADDNYRNVLYVRGQRIMLPQMMPNRYVRTAIVALGFWDGYRAHAGGVPTSFHFLGLGAPIMLPIVALCAYGTRDLSFDATSPILDAGEGFFYSDEPAYLKLRARKIAFALASGKQKSWNCPCGFCKQFIAKHPLNYEEAHKWFVLRKHSVVNASDLQPGGDLYTSLPLFSEPKNTTLRKAVTFARMGHNHWVLERIVYRLRDTGGSRSRLIKHLHDITNAYATHTESQVFAKSIGWVTDFVANKR